MRSFPVSIALENNRMGSECACNHSAYEHSWVSPDGEVRKQLASCWHGEEGSRIYNGRVIPEYFLCGCDKYVQSEEGED